MVFLGTFLCIFQQHLSFRDLFLDLSKTGSSLLKFLQEFSLNWGHVPAWKMLKKRKKNLPGKVLTMPLLTFECLQGTVLFIWKLDWNVREETAQKWLKEPRKLFNNVVGRGHV